VADSEGGFTCCVEQGHYGHAARKATWLYAHGIPRNRLPDLKWGPFLGAQRIDEGFNSKEKARAARNSPDFVPRKRLSQKQRIDTPIGFRDLLIGIASECARVDEVAA
jgi:hypothetical protein